MAKKKTAKKTTAKKKLYLELKKAGTAIKGTVTETKHKGWIQLESYSLDIEGPEWAPVDEREEAVENSYGSLEINKLSDKSSAEILKIMMEQDPGTSVTAVLEACSTQGKLLRKIELDDVVVSGYAISSEGTGRSESISLDYGGIRFEFHDSSGGKTTAGYDREQGELA